jgi:antitoxin (DNA-binding transcriptional repressor) of toxin-antitoxin stability system
MVITATELKTNIGHYLSAVSEDEVFITKNGKVVAKLSVPTGTNKSFLTALVGITTKNPVSLEKARKERLA